MKYFSTRNKNLNHSFKEVFLRGLAHDGGLFITQKLKVYNSSEQNTGQNTRFIVRLRLGSVTGCTKLLQELRNASITQN